MEKVMCGCRLLLKYAATKEAEIDVSGLPLRWGALGTQFGGSPGHTVWNCGTKFTSEVLFFGPANNYHELFAPRVWVRGAPPGPP